MSTLELESFWQACAQYDWWVVAEMAKEKNLQLLKYICLAPSHAVLPVAIQTLRVIGPLSWWPFLKDLGTRMW